MEKKKRTMIIILLVLSVIAFSVYKSENLNLNPIDAKTNLEECKSIASTQPGNINILFFSNKEMAEEYSNSLLGVTPLNENKEKFNIFYIDNYQPKCEIYKEQALLCYNEELIKKAASCPNDVIVAIQEQNGEIRSSAYMNVMSINSNHPLTVLAHEFGHTFANLAEEYSPAKIPKGSKNCAEDCSTFGDLKNGCFLGCSKSEYYRSIEEGIMRTLSSNNYGIFNENLILNEISKKVKQNILTGNVIKNKEDCSNQRYYLITGIYREGKILIKSVTKEIGCAGGNGKGTFTYKQISKENIIIKSDEFNPELIFTTNPENMEKGETYISDREFILKVLMKSETASLKIDQDNNPLASINFQEVSRKVKFSLTNSMAYKLNIKEKGNLDYVKLTGSIEGEGTVRIYLDNLLILDNSKPNKNLLTGGVINQSICGNGIIEANEVCDPPNNSYGSWCVNCQVPGNGGWNGCRGSGVKVCSDALNNISQYFIENPLCLRNDNCSGIYYQCNNIFCPEQLQNNQSENICGNGIIDEGEDCDPPKNPYGSSCNLSTCQVNRSVGGWLGCQGSGVRVCSNLLTNHSQYFAENPLCLRNDNCKGEYSSCNNLFCPEPPNGTKINCIDTDGGLNYYSWGEVYYFGKKYYNDSCLNNFTLSEAYCDGGFPKIQKYICQSECRSGICIKANESILTKKDNKIISFKDSCQETCELGNLNLNKESYILRIEISNAKLFLNEINYKVISFSPTWQTQ